MSESGLAFDDHGGAGELVVLLPGAGDVRSENRFLVPALAEAGYRVINADLPGHGESPPQRSYGVAAAADALLSLIRQLDAGPAHVVGTSFAPAAAAWAAGTEPGAVRSIVAISAHMEAEETFSSRMLGATVSGMLRGPWAAPIWGRMYRSWYKSGVPADFDAELGKMGAMLKRSEARRAVRETLTAHRRGLSAKIDACTCPALVIFGAADDHFPDPAKEAAHVAKRLRGEFKMVEGTGHYPHVERPDLVLPAVLDFLGRMHR